METNQDMKIKERHLLMDPFTNEGYKKLREQFTLDYAYDVLAHHNDWRRDKEYQMINATVIGLAIELIIEDYQKRKLELSKLEVTQ